VIWLMPMPSPIRKMTFLAGGASWASTAENAAAAQRAFAHRAEMNALASLGRWKPELERKSRVTAAT
jgi:hypothetical protein